jgi:hypothetical protein
MSSTATVTVAPGQVDALLDTLLTLYEVRLEELRRAILAHLAERRSAEPLLDELERLVEVERLIEQIGWEFGDRTRRIDLDGPAAIVREAVRETLVDVVEHLAATLDRYERGRSELTALGHAVRAVREWYALFERIEAPEGR